MSGQTSCPECFATIDPRLYRCPRCGHLLDAGARSTGELVARWAMMISISAAAIFCVYFLLRITNVIP